MLALALGGCGSAGTPDTGRGSYKVGKPYTIAGRTYYPAEDWTYTETGQASWYGPGFHGNSTANGEPYNQNLPSAAHRTLPMPSMVRVTNLENGRSTVVRINDRGPFARDRIIDLSKAAADQLDMVRAGVATVRVELLERESRLVKDVAINGGSAAEQLAAVQNMPAQPAQPAPVMVASAPPPPPPQPALPPPPAPAPAVAAAVPPVAASVLPTSAPAAAAPAVVPAVATVPPATSGWFVQAGAFANLANAERLREALARFGDTSIGQTTAATGLQLYRVRLGPYTTEDQAYNVRSALERAGHGEARIVLD